MCRLPALPINSLTDADKARLGPRLKAGLSSLARGPRKQAASIGVSIMARRKTVSSSWSKTKRK